MKYQLTIGAACKKHGVNRSTLNLWVKNGKVAAEKRTIGRKPVYFINEESLLEQMARSKATTTKPKGKPKQASEHEDIPEQKPEPQPGPAERVPDKSESDAKKKSKPRKRTRSNVVVTKAKNAMRPLDQEELIRVNTWLAKRILDKSNTPS